MGDQEPSVLWACSCALTFSWGRAQCCALSLGFVFPLIRKPPATVGPWALEMWFMPQMKGIFCVI